MLAVSNVLFSTTLINRDFIGTHFSAEKDKINEYAGDEGHLGSGLLYFSLVYMQKPKLCVFLGEGNAFVQKVVREAQKELKLSQAKTICIVPQASTYSEDGIIVRKDPINVVLKKWHKNEKIDFLHVSGDMRHIDVKRFIPHMSQKGIITFHKTKDESQNEYLVNALHAMGYEMVNMECLGEGMAIIHLGKK